jgi:hypothetical protein
VTVQGKCRLYKCEKNNEDHVEYELNLHRDGLGSDIQGDSDSLGGYIINSVLYIQFSRDIIEELEGTAGLLFSSDLPYHSLSARH